MVHEPVNIHTLQLYITMHIRCTGDQIIALKHTHTDFNDMSPFLQFWFHRTEVNCFFMCFWLNARNKVY